MSIIVGALLLPALLIGTWVATWFVRRSRRWLYYFPAALAAVGLVAAVTFLTPHPACESSSPMMCLDDVSLFGTANTLTGFSAWLILLLITGAVELAQHLAYVSRLRRTTDEIADTEDPLSRSSEKAMLGPGRWAAGMRRVSPRCLPPRRSGRGQVRLIVRRG